MLWLFVMCSLKTDAAGHYASTLISPSPCVITFLKSLYLPWSILFEKAFVCGGRVVWFFFLITGPLEGDCLIDCLFLSENPSL